MRYRFYTTVSGLSMVEVIITAALLGLFFSGFLAGYTYVFDLVQINRSTLTAVTLLNDRIEYVRSLSYDSVGTIAGIPSGPIPQISTTTLNGIEFTERVLIEYVDDPADGLGSSDSNSITTDYKRVKVSYTWEVSENSKEIFAVTNIVPRSIESNSGGGTLRVNVFDAEVFPMSGAQVRLYNTSGTSTIDVTRTTDAGGSALFSGAPAGSNYEIFVSRLGYSSDQTYVATTSIPNPTTLPVTVLEADITTMNFFIDELSSLTIRAFSSKNVADATEDFTDASGIATSTDTEIVGNELLLTEGGGVYSVLGTALLNPIAPGLLARWDRVNVDFIAPTDTEVRWSLYVPGLPPTLISDSDLPGNSAGFVSPSLDISGLSVSAYPTLQIGLELRTTSFVQTPRVQTVRTSYLTSAPVLAGIPLTLTSQKSIGTNALFEPVPKHQYTGVTNGLGEWTIDDLEWGAYTLDVGSYSVAESCPDLPLSIVPDSSQVAELILVPATSNSLRVVVSDSGLPVPDALVTLSRPGFSETKPTTTCGQVFFEGISSEVDYSLEVDIPGHGIEIVDPLEIDGNIIEIVSV